jgi:hypothetical protein
MADYHSILAKAVDALDPNTPRARQRVYSRARSAMRSTIESTEPRTEPGMDGVSLPGAREATTPSEERRGWHILCLGARSVCDN